MCIYRIILILLISHSLFLSSLSLKIGETCSKNGDCDTGLKCETCPANGNTRPRCTRTRPILPTTKVKGLPFNKYSWLTTHNSFAISGGMKSGTGSFLLAPTNQEDTVTSQLQNGVRGLMLDMYDFQNDIWLCHSFGGQCFNFTAFQPAVNVLKEVQAFLVSNPTEIVTIFIEDYVRTPNGLTNVFKAASLDKFMFPLSQMPQNGGDWPTVDDMVQKNQRLLLFTSAQSKEASEQIAYNWKYVVENQYGDAGMASGPCVNRGESPPMDTTSISLVLENYFPDNPNSTQACADNSAALDGITNTCVQQDGKRWPNYIAVDYYQRSDGGGAAEVVDKANGHLTCGCSSIAYCKENATFGSCNVPPMAPPPPAALAPGKSSPGKGESSSLLFNGAYRESLESLQHLLFEALLSAFVVLLVC